MKKLLSLLLVLAMTLSLAVPMVSAADFTDVDNTHQYFEAIQSLVARGIISGMGDGTFAPDANIKRSEFAKMVVLSIGLTNAGEAVESSGFPDVAKDHWAAGFIKTAFGQGIINGFEDGTFRPDENVTYEQAVTMVIRAKSPFLKAEADKIGYPDGYLQIANKYRFLKGITDGINKQPAKRGTIAKLMDNMLKVELKSDDLGGIPQIEPEQSEEVKGQVMAVRGTSLIAGDTDSLNTYQIKLKESDGDIVIYDAKNTSVKDSLRSYLGKQVTVYYDEDVSARIQVLSSIGEQRGRNYEVNVSLDAIEDYSNTLVKYDDGNRGDRITVDDPIIMYNGSLTTTDLETLIDENQSRAGSIRFLCSEGEGSAADVIFFTSYTNWYVTSTTSSTKMVYGEIAGVRNNIEIDDEARDKTVTITKNGKAVPFSSIQKGQILSISKSDDEKVIDVIISDKTVSGTVTAKNDSLNNITVQSKTYGFTDGLTSADINLGVTLKLYIDAFDKIAKYTHQMVSTNYVYGYLLKASNDGSSMDGKVAMKILKLNTTSVASPAQVYLADSVTINNVNYKPTKDANDIIALLKETAEYYDASSGNYDFGADAVFQPIRYSTAADGTVNALFIGTQAVEATDSDLKVDKSFADSAITYTGTNTFANFYKMNSSTKVVYIPDNDADRTDNNKYVIRSGSNASLVQGATYKIVMVDLNASSIPAVVLMYSSSENVASAEWEDCVPMLVKGKVMGTGSYPYEITLMSASGEVTYYDEAGAFYDAVKIGDVVRISAASDNKVEEYEIVAEATEIFAGTEYIKPITHLTEETRQVDKTGTPLAATYPMHSEGDRNVTRKIVLFAGVAYDVVDGNMKIVLDYPEAGVDWTDSSLIAAGNVRPITVSGAKVITVEMRNGTVKNIVESDIEQIQPYVDSKEATPKMVVYCYGDNAKLIVVYKDANN